MKAMKPILLSVALSALIGTTALADFSYQETTKMTGGMMMRQGGTAPKPQTYATYVKGNRMARIGAERGQITDLDKETVTNVNYANKTYSVMTFAQMKSMMAQMGGAKEEPGEVNVTSHETGKTRVIGNVTAKEMLMTVKVAGSEIDTDVWLGPMVPGYEEVRQFQQRMARKMGDVGAPGMQRTMQEATKALIKANGIPLQQMASIHGGSPPGAPGSGKPMLETSTELSGLSSASVDSSKFDIPAGFQKREVGMGVHPLAPTPQSKPAHQ